MSVSTEVAPATLSKPGVLSELGCLRAWITLLVVAHHAVLAYHPYASPAPTSLSGDNHMWAMFPIVDRARWEGFSLFTTANEFYFMALMFLLSGLFVWPALDRKGVARFTGERLVRLGIPFLVAAGLLAPLAYVPTFLTTGAPGGWTGFWSQWLTPGVWSSGPAWFAWVLLAFGLLAAALAAVWPGARQAFARAGAAMQSPWRLHGTLAIGGFFALIPLEFAFTGFHWSSWGIFAVQTSRILYYLFYFAAGMALGAHGAHRDVLAADGPLARRWGLFANLGGGAFALALVAIIAAFRAKPLGLPLHLAADGAFTLATASMSLAAIAIFLRFARGPQPVFAALIPCAYGMYLLHYPVVTFLQYALLPVAFPGLVKGVIVALAGIAISWGLVALLRRIPLVARVI